MRYSSHPAPSQQTQPLRGQVVSIVSNYGFIRDNSGVSYYFNPTHMDKSQPYADLKPGSAVEFSVKAGPKGMIALDVKAVMMHVGVTIPGKLIMLRDGQTLRKGEFFDEMTLVPIQSSWHRSPNDALNELKKAIAGTGANLAIDLSVVKSTFSEGNYNYTMHSYVAHAGIYWTNVLTEDAAQANKSEALKNTHLNEVIDEVEREAQRLASIRKKQEESSFKTVIQFVVFISVLLLLFSLFR